MEIPLVVERGVFALAHLFIVLSVLGCAFLVVRTIVDTHTRAESVVRSVASVVGVFVYVITKALGVTLPQTIIEGVASVSLNRALVMWVVPSALLGWVVAFVLLRSLRRSGIAIRMVIFIATLLILFFTDTYAATFEVGGLANNALMPNIAFVIGLGFYVMLNYRTEDHDETDSPEQNRTKQQKERSDKTPPKDERRS
ncbi:MAG: hypothetical protein U5L04_08780 [Trueperaceae bacterium]|nr:hypothetical protein [Trueperaceae bacterium]